MTCAKCGVVAEGGTRFCGNCGNSLYPAAPPHGIQAPATQAIPNMNDAGATELPPAVKPGGPVHAAPTAMSPAAASSQPQQAQLLHAPATRLNSELSQSVHALTPPAAPPPVAQPPTTRSEPRVPVNTVSNIMSPHKPVAPLQAASHRETEAQIKAMAIWYQLYGGVAVAMGFVLFSTALLASVLSLVFGVLALYAGVALFRCTGLGRTLAIVVAALMIVACVYGVATHTMGAWTAAGAAFGLLTILSLMSGHAAEVCTPRYQNMEQDSPHDVVYVGSPWFWGPGVLTGVTLIIQALMFKSG